MEIAVVVIVVLLLVATFVAVVYYLGIPLGGSGQGRSNLRSMVAAQRNVNVSQKDKPKRSSIFQSAAESKVRKTVSARLTLTKRLKYAQWKMSPAMFHGCEVFISVVAFALVVSSFNVVIQVMSWMCGPIFMRWRLNRSMDKRFKAFDADYPSFLLSLVGLLKTGMNVMNALEAAARGLDDDSLVKLEVDMMIERLRFGVSEDKSIGSFGEDIYHPEIELFVQALLLSRRVGGTLSDTLERLAKQVRKRQFFRASANAAVSMQRGSIWFIIGILGFIEFYLYWVYPEAVVGAWKDDLGWEVWQTGLLFILFGLFWVRQVTKIRV
jgi:tight adherence protein B